MQTVLELLDGAFREALGRAFPGQETPVLEIEPSSQEKFGHYQFNSSMKLAKQWGRPPREIAEAIVCAFDKGNLVESLSIAGPGFINIVISPQALERRLMEMLKDTHLGIQEKGHGHRVVIDFSSPNIAKEMHVGHLRSTIIGDCLSRLLEFLGYDVLRVNHVGDWGTAFGMLIAYMRQNVPKVLDNQEPTDLSHLMAWYKASKEKFDLDPEFKKTSQLEVVKLQSGDPDTLAAWQKICDISRQSYAEIYALLNVRIQERGESTYNPLLPGIVQELEALGLIELSGGAKCLFLEGFVNREGNPLPLMVQKSDGGYNYDTTDMAALKYRVQVDGADRLIYVTDAGQATHFAMIFKAGEKAHYYDPKTVRLDHVPFGLVLGADGKKFKTRSGDTEKLIDLLKAAIDRAETILRERSPDMDEDGRKQLAKALGIGAVKYADLSSHRTSDYTFSYDRMLRFEGNTAAYLMYSYVRIAGIKRKVQREIDSLIANTQMALNHSSEISLALHLNRFGEILDLMASELLPHRLTEYLYSLAEKFNAFFRDCRVEGAVEQDSRLLLCEVTARVMRQGLEILGLEVVERM